jgi:hypothetical protein
MPSARPLRGGHRRRLAFLAFSVEQLELAVVLLKRPARLYLALLGEREEPNPFFLRRHFGICRAPRDFRPNRPSTLDRERS